ncbi:hypothetical protein F4813DRAFT_23492 [Daldinia decipiens]|uniref:uncharacterized protein n=1 Tax=Daldinia decipiens TaxID=326647 RepID=UPI0020C4567E|nr:uncharacterized protein F4813DRAFT_23492 [Daldinia decipiens]KAI1659155.1 hypothetical protein F4813DRAFT_23492 [Daldinia decipiens]
MLGCRTKPAGCKPSGCHTKPTTSKSTPCKSMPCFIRSTTTCHTKKLCDAPCCKVEVERRDQVSSKHCKKHIVCIAIGCMNARMQYYDRGRAGTPQYKRRKYCFDHKCIATECPNQRAPMLAPNQYRPFCDDHNCRATDCPNQALEGTTCCRGHKCQIRDCMHIAAPPFPFCLEHNRCEWGPPICNRPKERNRKYCREHLQCQTPGCVLQKIEGSLHCMEHACRERGCNISSGEHDYCDDHRCEWEEECEYAKSGERYCPLHSCRSEGCPECVNCTGIFCDTHACSRCGCKVEAKPCLENKCYDHWKEDVETCVRAEWCDEKRGLTQRLSEKDHFIQEQDRRLREQHDQLWKLQSGQRN